MTNESTASLSSSLRIAEVSASAGRVGITLCPGKKGASTFGGTWDRDLAQDIAAIRDWGASAIVTLIEAHEFELLSVPQLPAAVAEAGIEYVADWVLDDQPCEIQTASGPIVSVPYTVDLNDIPMMVLQNHPSEEWLRRGIDHFDRLHAEGEKSMRVMAISVHPYITGAPHRISYLEKLYEYILSREGALLWTGEQILDWYLGKK